MSANFTCEYTMDTGCVEIRVPDEGLVVDINCTIMERSVADIL